MNPSAFGLLPYFGPFQTYTYPTHFLPNSIQFPIIVTPWTQDLKHDRFDISVLTVDNLRNSYIVLHAPVQIPQLIKMGVPKIGVPP